MNDFFASVVIIVYTCAIFQAQSQLFLDTALKMSLEYICGVKYEKGTINVKSLYLNDDSGRSQISVNAILSELKRVSGLIFPDVVINARGGWQREFAPYIWQWLHIVTIHLDLSASLNERINFLVFVERIILCVDCKKHFIDNVENIRQCIIETGSIAKTFLALHTSINRYIQGSVFTYDKNDINEKHRIRFFKEYIKLRGL